MGLQPSGGRQPTHPCVWYTSCPTRFSWNEWSISFRMFLCMKNIIFGSVHLFRRHINLHVWLWWLGGLPPHHALPPPPPTPTRAHDDSCSVLVALRWLKDLIRSRDTWSRLES